MGASGSVEITQQLASQSKTHVKITGLKLHKMDTKQLAESTLKGNCVLKALDLSANQLGDQGAQELARVLKGNTTLETLNLSGNKLQAASVALSELLVDSNALRILDLSNNNLGDEGATRLGDILPKNSTLVRLNLSYNKIAFKGARKLWAGLMENTRLRALCLKGNVIGDMGTMALDSCLKANSTLVSLDLAENHIGESGSTRIAEALRGAKGVMELMMQGNVVGDDAGVSFAQTLKTNKVLSTLNLNNTKLGWAAAVAIGQALQVNSTLVSLGLLNCDIGGDGASALEAAAKLNRLVVIEASYSKLSATFEDEMKMRKSAFETNEDGIMRLSTAFAGVEVSAGRNERDQKMAPQQPKPSSQDYQGRTRKEVLAQISQLNQLVEASKSDGETGVGVRRDALERILSLAMSISDKDIILSATAMLKAVMEQDTAGLLVEPVSEATIARRQTQTLAPQSMTPPPPLKKAMSGRLSLSPAPRKRTVQKDDRSRSSSLLTSFMTRGERAPGDASERGSDQPTERERPSGERTSERERPSGGERTSERERNRPSMSPGRSSSPARCCSMHHLPLRFYDQQCGQTLCQECLATTHKGHVVVSLFEYATQCRQELAETLAAARKVLSAAEKKQLEEKAAKVALP
jgi:Ran GTPase-activating protein (RanGAP) involved in mRNA processing and transport